MAGIGKSTNKSGGKAGEDVTALRRELDALKGKVVSARKNRALKDITDDKEKRELRSLYLQIAGVARKLAETVDDMDLANSYRNDFDTSCELAQKCGSSVNSRIPKTTFDDVKGMDEVKKLIKSFLFMAEHEDIVKMYKLEGGLGLLMYGAPGTGKTMFAEAIANAMNLPLFIVTPADIFKSYVGESEQAVRQLFDEIDACPDGAILFVDECESIFSVRTKDTKDYKAAVTTELLQRINGFGGNGSKRIMIAATNRPDVIDPAYLRYKRFSHIVHVTPPDHDAVKSIVKSKLTMSDEKDKKEDEAKTMLAPDITIDDVVNMFWQGVTVTDRFGTHTEQIGYYSAADVCGILEEACRIALEEIQASGDFRFRPLTRAMFEKAFEKTPPSISVEQLNQYKNFLLTRKM